MNYALKMKSILMVLGILVLQGCKTNNNQSLYSSYSTDHKSSLLKTTNNLDTETNKIECLFAFANKIRCETKRMSSIELCTFLRHKNNKKTKFIKRFKEILDEVKIRNLDCDVKENLRIITSNQTKELSKRPLVSVSDSIVCTNATTRGNSKIWNTKNDNFVNEANHRGLDCGMKTTLVS